MKTPMSPGWRVSADRLPYVSAVDQRRAIEMMKLCGTGRDSVGFAQCFDNQVVLVRFN
jgi:hypothetical protein